MSSATIAGQARQVAEIPDEEAPMASIRLVMTLVLALTLGLALPVAAQPLSGPEFIDLTPCRILDTRTGSLCSGGVTNVKITEVCGVAANATAASLNFTITGPVANGHLTVFPANGGAPLASLVNYVAGQTVANAADVRLGAGTSGIEPGQIVRVSR
jgi:hypothetical protein